MKKLFIVVFLLDLPVFFGNVGVEFSIKRSGAFRQRS